MKISELTNKCISSFNENQYDKAMSYAKEILSKDPGNIAASHVMAKVFDANDDFNNAIIYYEKVWKSNKENHGLLLEYGRALRLAKDPVKAIEILSKADQIQSTYYTCLELGLAKSDTRDLDGASEYLTKSIGFKRDSIIALNRLGDIETLRNDHEKAIMYYQQVLDIKPHSIHSFPKLIMACLENGDPEKALGLCEKCLDIDPSCTGALALKYVALVELNRAEEAAKLCDESLIVSIKPKCPEGFNSIDDFNQYLTDHILNHTEMFSGLDKYSTINGSHSEMNRLFENNRELEQKVMEMLHSATDQYISMLPKDDTHPVNAVKSKDYDLSTWAVVMQHQGHQLEHVHPVSWLAGCYYIKLPDDFDEQKAPNAGCIAFGRGTKNLHKKTDINVITKRPIEGEIVFFPGYYWHHTIPLESNYIRICMAFDVIAKK